MIHLLHTSLAAHRPLVLHKLQTRGPFPVPPNIHLMVLQIDTGLGIESAFVASKAKVDLTTKDKYERDRPEVDACSREGGDDEYCE